MPDSIGWRWFHTQVWLHGHWLPGDPRGFRSKNHRIHSSGDYKSPPPQGEHAGLHAHASASLTQKPIILSTDQRRLIAGLFARWCAKKRVSVAAVSVGGAHAHLLAMLPGDQPDLTIGKIKRYASCESRREDKALPSRLFAEKCEPKRVKDWEHFVASYGYVVDKHAREGAWVWGAGEDALGALWRGGGER